MSGGDLRGRSGMVAEINERCTFPLRSFSNTKGHDGVNEDILHHKVLLIYSHWITKTLSQYKARHTSQWTRIQSSEINLYIYSSLFSTVVLGLFSSVCLVNKWY